MITREDRNFSEVSAQLERRLQAFNEAAGGPLRRTPVVFTIRDENGALIGGLTGESFWNAVYVQHLWVDAAHRRRGYGAALLQEVEDAARCHACDVVYLSTFDFQARRFYEGRGYVVFGELHNVPPGSKRRWFRKDLRATAV